MSPDRFEATYLIETPLDPAHVAEVLAGEQSCGTFTRVEGETDALRERARATVESVELLDVAPAPSLPNGWMQRRGMFDTPQTWQRARLRVSFPCDNIGPNLPTLAATASATRWLSPESITSRVMPSSRSRAITALAASRGVSIKPTAPR